MSNKQELIKRLEIRKEALLGDVDLGYPIHSGHHLRDIVTMLAYLRNKTGARKLINNLCLNSK